MINSHSEIRFSIITVCLDAGEKLFSTINSVLNQTYKNYEYIIKDGGSADETIESINKLHSNIKLICLKDTGIYNAMNQALHISSGDYIIFLNAGDLFANNDVLEKVAMYINHQQASIYYGNYYNAFGEYCILPKVLTKFFLYSSFLCHQSVFYEKKMIVSYDESFRLLADHDFHVKSFCNNVLFCNMPIAVCKYEGGGVSENTDSYSLHKKEVERIRKKYFTNCEQRRYYLKYVMTFPQVRAWLYGDKSPKWLKSLYRKIVTKVRK